MFYEVNINKYKIPLFIGGSFPESAGWSRLELAPKQKMRPSVDPSRRLETFLKP